MLKRIVSFIKEKSIKAIPVVVFLMLMTAAINIYLVKVENEQLRGYKDDVVTQSKENEWNLVSTIIESSYRTSKQNSMYLAQKVEDGILKQYPDLTSLKKQFDTRDFEKDFYSVLKDNLSEEDMNLSPLFPTPYRTVVATNDGVIATFSNESNENQSGNTKVMSWNDYYSLYPNTTVAREAIEDVINRKDKIILIQGESTTNKVHSLDMDKLKKIYLKDGIKALENYSFLAPSYIHSTTDIFGQEDTNFMKPSKNYKIIIIQSTKLSDILNQNMDKIQAEEEQAHLTTQFVDNFVSSKNITGLIWSFLMFALSLILISIYNNEEENCKCDKSCQRNRSEGGLKNK